MRIVPIRKVRIRMKKLSILIVLSMLLMGCTSNSNDDNPDGLSIVTTSFVTYDFARAIATDDNVNLLIKPGQDAHSFEPTTQDMIDIENSDLLIYTNDGMEPWVNGLLDESILKLDASKNITYLESDHDHSHDHDEEAHDHSEEDHDHGEEDHDHGEAALEDAPVTVVVEGLNEHYHTGDELVLDATDSTHPDYDHWHWFTRHDDHEAWEAVADTFSGHLHYTAPDASLEMMAVLYDNDHHVVGRSEVLSIVVDNHDHDHDHESNDPHTWTSMKNAVIMVGTIRDSLIELKPENKDTYTENAQALITEIQQLDQDYATVFEAATIEPLVFLGHFGLNYLLHDYGVAYLALFESMSHETEPTVAQMRLIIDTIEDHDLKYVFVEELAQIKLVQTIEAETGVETLELHSTHNITQQQLDDGVTFVEIQKQNVENLKVGLK